LWFQAPQTQNSAFGYYFKQTNKQFNTTSTLKHIKIYKVQHITLKLQHIRYYLKKMNPDEIFKENVINSFKKARKDMLELQNSLVSLKQEIDQLRANLEPKSSTGNEGVFNKQTNQQTNKQLNKQTIIQQSNTLSKLNEDLEAHFNTLTKQEFLVFLSLYQLEEELSTVKFSDLANHLNLSESSIRGYINRLIQKGSPILRKRVNNKVINLSLSSDFRNLNLKKRLTDIYYQSDASQKRLFDRY